MRRPAWKQARICELRCRLRCVSSFRCGSHFDGCCCITQYCHKEKSSELGLLPTVCASFGVHEVAGLHPSCMLFAHSVWGAASVWKLLSSVEFAPGEFLFSSESWIRIGWISSRLGFHFYILQVVYKFCITPSMPATTGRQHFEKHVVQKNRCTHLFKSAVGNVVPQSTSLAIKKVFLS